MQGVHRRGEQRGGAEACSLAALRQGGARVGEGRACPPQGLRGRGAPVLGPSSDTCPS